MPEPLAGLVARALTGTAVPLPDASTPGEIAAALQQTGWDAERIASIRQHRLAAGEHWPWRLDPVTRGPVGPAQLYSATQAVITELGLAAQPRLRDQHAELGPRERALLAERPPHHGSVG